MKLSRRKILTVISAVIILAVLLTAAAVGLWIWYWPMRWNQEFQNSYLLRNQPAFRTAGITPGNFNKLLLSQVELGPSGKELFCAPNGSITLSIPDNKNWNAPHFRVLQLDNCNIKLHTRNRQIYLNNYLLADFLQAISALPPGPDGQPFAIKLNGQLLNENSATANIELQIIPDKPQNVLMISMQWKSSGNSRQQGCWNSHINLASGVFSASFSGDLPTEFYQEFLLRSRVPAPLAALLQQGSIHGSGKIHGSIKTITINDLIYSGRINNPLFKWYNQNNIKAGDLEITLHKTPKLLSVKIPRLQLNIPGTLLLQDIALSCQSNKSTVKFAAQSDLRSAGINFFCEKLDCAALALPDTQQDAISGSWDLKSGRWQLNGKAGVNKQKNLQFGSGSSNKLTLTPEKLSFHAYGTGGRGHFKQDLQFAHLELHHAGSVFKAEQGNLHASAELGAAAGNTNHTLAFNMAKFSADTHWGQLDLPNLAGELDLRQYHNKTQEIYIVSRGSSAGLISPQGRLDLQQWTTSCTLEKNRPDQAWKIANWDLKSPKIELDSALTGGKLQLDRLNISASGIVNKFLPQQGKIKLSAVAAVHERFQAQKLDLNLDFDSKRTPAKKLQSTFFCSRFTSPNSSLPIRLAENIAIQFAGDGLNIPNRTTLQADTLHLALPLGESRFLKSQWQLQKSTSPRQWDCDIKFSHLTVKTPHDKLGNGSFSAGTLSLQSELNDQWQVTKLQAIGDLSQPAWRYFQLHAGAENMQTHWEFNSTGNGTLQGSFKLKNANLLGEYFSASTPELASQFSWQDNHAAGKLHFAPGTISSHDNKLEMIDAEFLIPFTASSTAPAELPEGYLKASACRWLGQNEGVLSSSIKHFLHTGSNLNMPLSHTLKFRGQLRAEKFAKAPVKINADWHLPPEQPALSCSFNMPKHSLQQPIQLNNYLPIPHELAVLKGLFSISGQADCRPGDAQMQLQVQAQNSDWQAGELAAEAVNANWQMNIQDGQTLILPQDVTAQRILWKNWQLNNNRLNLALNPGGELFVSSWQGKFQNGTFKLAQPLTLAPAGANAVDPSISFTVEQIPAGKFFAALNLRAINSSALLSGRVQAQIIDDRIYFSDSRLGFKSPAGELLQIRPQDPRAVKISDPQYSAFAQAVLGSMKCYQAQFDFATSPGELTMLLKAEGVPTEPVPFVYQGRKSGSPFRPAAPGERGFDGEIELNVNLKLHPDEPGI